MSFDISALLRRLKPDKKVGPLRRRGDDALPFVCIPTTDGPSLLFDTTVYIDMMKDHLPDEVIDLIAAREIHHSPIAVAELAHSFGRLDPIHPKTADSLAAVREAIDAIPDHRLRAPTSRAIVEAGILSGIVARVSGRPDTDKQPLFNDAVLFFQALEQGCCLLSRNIVDLDAFLQLIPTGRVLLYRQTP